MLAWLMNSMNGIETLRLAEVEDPQPGPGQVLLKVRFAALNPADAFLSRGMYPAKPNLPHILGRDGVGEVVQTGLGVTHVRQGNIVGILRCDVGVEVWGTLAEMVVVPADSVVPVPKGWSLEEMAGAPLVYLTAWQALTQWTDPPAPPSPGRLLLVTGASGGVGVASVQLGKAMGLTVVALSRREEKRAKLKELGADMVFDPSSKALVKTLKTVLQPRAIDLVVDAVAGPLLNDVLALLGHGGRISLVGRSGGPVPELNTASLFFRRIRMGGVAVGDYSSREARPIWEEIVQRLDATGQRPQVDSIMPFEQVPSAFSRLSAGPMGKVLIRVAA
jgi:NADPH2:quinone reductase